ELTSIGGSAAQPFQDNGGNSFSYQATLPAATTAGPKTIPVTITDAQARTGSASISLTVNAATTNPTGVGAANPASLVTGNSTLLTVTVTPGTGPTSTALAVAANLSSIGGGASQQFF